MKFYLSLILNTSEYIHIFFKFCDQVAKSDYQKFNEFAEGAMIARNIAKATEIKIQRRSLLHR